MIARRVFKMVCHIENFRGNPRETSENVKASMLTSSGSWDSFYDFASPLDSAQSHQKTMASAENGLRRKWLAQDSDLSKKWLQRKMACAGHGLCRKWLVQDMVCAGHWVAQEIVSAGHGFSKKGFLPYSEACQLHRRRMFGLGSISRTSSLRMMKPSCVISDSEGCFCRRCFAIQRSVHDQVGEPLDVIAKHVMLS